VNFLDALGSAIGGAFNPQIQAVESEAQTLAQAVAVWGVVVAVELGVIIFLLRRKS
jgi:hypothetical protein